MGLCTIQERNLMENLVRNVKQELLQTSHYINENTLAGLCFRQYDHIKCYLNTNHPDLDFKIKHRHGELNHILDLPSQAWGVQHTIVELQFNDAVYYVDLTSCQFSELGLPNVYYSKIYPRWHLSDLNNRALRISHLTAKLGLGRVNIITKFLDWLVYDVKGFTYDYIRKILKKT